MDSSRAEHVDTVVIGTCKDRPDACSEERQRRDGDNEATEALARLAVNSADPQVYAWAHRFCVEVPRATAGTCLMINALQWARLDPANAEPWFAVAREARSRRDAAGLDDAMFHVAAAEVHDPGWGRATAQMIMAAPQPNGMVVGTWLAALTAISYESLDLSSLQDASRYCEARSLGNANRRDTCEKIATLLADRSTTLLARASGLDLGQVTEALAAGAGGSWSLETTRERRRAFTPSISRMPRTVQSASRFTAGVSSLCATSIRSRLMASRTSVTVIACSIS